MSCLLSRTSVIALNTHISQGSVVTYLRRGRIFSYRPSIITYFSWF